MSALSSADPFADDTVDLVIVGGGPAGLAAALESDRWGTRAVLIEDRPTLGGQIFRQPSPSLRRTAARAPGPAPPAGTAPLVGARHNQGQALIEQVRCGRVRLLMDATVVDITPTTPFEVRCTVGGRTLVIRTRQVILATGAYDRPVALPGWTLPGVIAAGGAQAIGKSHGVRPGQRAVIAGSGPLVFAFAMQLHQWGVQVGAVAEAAPRPRVRQLAELVYRGAVVPDYLRQGMHYVAYLARHRVPIHFRTTVLRVLGSDQVTGVTLGRVDAAGRPITGLELTVDADHVCLGYGLVPSQELARLCGCELTFDSDSAGQVPVRNSLTQTSVPGVFAVGDGVAVRGSAAALVEGRIAGIAASRNLGRVSAALFEPRLRRMQARLWHHLRFQRAVAALYPYQIRSSDIAQPDTLICRCEDVTKAELADAIAEMTPLADANVVKGATRAGMGLCQGRMCAPNVYELIAQIAGVSPSVVCPFSARPPARPVPLSAIAVSADFAATDDDIPDDPDCAG